ncbi:MAG: SDR family NAD(P)-dependent oxidoreductase [Xanthobacteraceae bacterium]
MNALAGRVALVTGAGRGIGRSVAVQLAGEGARVVLNDLDEAPARETVALIEAQGGEAIAVVGSVTEAAFPQRFVAAALDRFGAVDIVVNNAGYIWNSRIEATSDEQWNAMLDVHLTAPFRIVRQVVQHWKQPAAAGGGGAGAAAALQRKIVNVSSISGTHGATGQIAYSSAKAGLIGLTKSLARELGPLGVNVNAVAFGWIETRLTQEARGETVINVGGHDRRVGLPKAALEELRNRVPLRRGGSPEEAAGSVLLLCLPASDYISGQIVDVDGGIAI